MPKYFSWPYVKQHPIMFGTIVIVFGLILYMLMNKRAPSGSASNTVVQTGPTDAQAAMAMQMGMAQLGAQTQMQIASIGASTKIAELNTTLAMNQNSNETALSLASLEANLRAAELASNERLTARSQDASLSAMDMQLQTQLRMQENNNQFQYDYASLAYDSALETVKVNAALQATMGAQQLEAFKFSTTTNADLTKFTSALSVIPTLKKKTRDEALAGIMGYTDIPNNDGGGGGGFLKLVSPIAGALS